jgi:hypothetical protein
MSLRSWFRVLFAGPVRIDDAGAEGAEEPEKVAEQMTPVGGWTESPLAPAPPHTMALEGDKEASDRPS